MTKLQGAKLALALLCALLTLGCGGGGGSDSAGGEPPPTQSPPPPPAPEDGPPPPSAGQTRPALYIEKDPDGTVNLRVLEQVHDPFAPNAPQRTVRDRKLGPSPGTNFEIGDNLNTLVWNVDIVRMKHGLTLLGSGVVSIYDYSYTQFDGDGSIHGGAIKLGDNNRPTNGTTYIQRVFADGMQIPDATYGVSNTDFIGAELDSGPIYVRDVTGRNFGDAGIDSKSTQVYVMNATMQNVHRVVRAWRNVEIILVNSIINAAPGHLQGWVQNGAGTVRYFNTLWCLDSAAPSGADPACRAAPWLVEADDISEAAAAARFIALSSNPLPAISSFFHTSADEIVVEYSGDAGATWQVLALPNTGGPGAAPVGDPRYRIPLDLAAGDYRFRAWYELNGAKVGETSLVVGETGAVVP